MKTLINKPVTAVAAAKLDHVGRRTNTHRVAMFWRRLPDAPRALFAAPPPDLLTLVIADQLKRKAQAEIQRDAFREALYDMPVAPERHEERSTNGDSFDDEE